MAFARRDEFVWQLQSRSLELGKRTLVMGVLNVTPDSFSDGNLFLDSKTATAYALRMFDEGADIVDIGGESTRPGRYEPVTRRGRTAPRASGDRSGVKGAAGLGAVDRYIQGFHGGYGRGEPGRRSSTT